MMLTRTLRPESSVAAAIDEAGELVFGGDAPSAVRHRTPEELGLSRVVPDEAPGRLMPWIDQAAVWKVRQVREFAASAAEVERAQKLKQLDRELGLAPEREEVPTVAPSFSSEEVEVTTEEAPVMTDGRTTGTITKERIEAIKAAPEMSAVDLARQLGISRQLIYFYRSKLKKEAGVQTVTIDPQQAGGAASLERALAKIDEAPVAAAIAPVVAVRDTVPGLTVKLELTLDEARGLMGKLSEAQGVRFFEAGLRAALLA